MPNEPLRRVLFPTPPRSDVATPPRPVQTIRPKAELTPINLDSTPTFKRLVENSPVPLAVAAASAAIRAAQTARTGNDIVTDMTRAAEEVVNKPEYNSIRPPLPSPRSLASPRLSAIHAAHSASASLPPIPSPTIRPAGVMNAVRNLFSRPSPHPRWSNASPTNNRTHDPSNRHGVSRHKALLPAPQSPSRAPGKRIGPSSLHSNPLSRLFHRVSANLDDDATSGLAQGHTLSNTNVNVQTSANRAESIEKSRKRPFLKASKRTLETQAPENKENGVTRIQTRSLKRSRPDPDPMASGGSKSRKPKKRRRMSEVFRLQKALESAAWTNSRAVEMQTEVIEISDSSPSRPRPEASIKLERKSPRDSDAARGGVRTKTPHYVKTPDKKAKSKTRVRSVSDPHKHKKALVKPNQSSSTNKQGKRTVTALRRKQSSTKKAKSGRDGGDKPLSSKGLQESSIQKKRTKREKEKKKERMWRFRRAVSHDGKQVHDNTRENTNNSPTNISTASLGESQVPLKKRTPSERPQRDSVSKLDALDSPLSSVDARLEKSSRKPPNPKRLSPPTSKDGRTLPTPKVNLRKTKRQELIEDKG